MHCFLVFVLIRLPLVSFFFFFNDTATTEIYTLSLHDALPISSRKTGPEANGLVSFNADGRWGLLVSADYSDTTRFGTAGGGKAGGKATENLDQYGVILHGENAGTAGAYNPFLGARRGGRLPSPAHP